jgi:hypothetical protein
MRDSQRYTVRMTDPRPRFVMAVSPHLQRKLQETLGADAADDLVTILDTMDANRGDVRELRHEMQLGFARVEAKFEAALEKGLREQTRFFFLAWSVLLAAIVGLYARNP